jgi:hypothetical protein
VSARSRQERARKRERRVRRREAEARRADTAREAAHRAREERLARLGPLVEMYGEGSELLRMVDKFTNSDANRVWIMSPNNLPPHETG